MLEGSQVLECTQLHAQGRSIRSIAREHGVARNTVRDCLRGERLPGDYTLKASRLRPVSEALEARVREMLLAEQAAPTPHKQRLTAARIGLVRAGERVEASESTVRAAVARCSWPPPHRAARLCFNLDALPLTAGGLRSILDGIYLRAGVDAMIQGDTEVEHVRIKLLRYQP